MITDAKRFGGGYIYFGDKESEIKELTAELKYYIERAKECREEAQRLISEAIRYEVSAENRREKIMQLEGDYNDKG